MNLLSSVKNEKVIIIIADKSIKVKEEMGSRVIVVDGRSMVRDWVSEETAPSKS